MIYGIIPPIHFHIFQDGYCTTNQYTQFDQKWVVHTIPNGRLMVIGCGLQAHVAANPSLPFVMKVAAWNHAHPLEIFDGQLESCGYYS